MLSGQDEARLTFLAVRRWFGWSSGHLLALDIGGGSLEIAAGIDEVPDAALSLPLGAGRLTRERLPGDPPSADDVRALRRHIRVEIGAVVRGGGQDRYAGPGRRHVQDAALAGPGRRRRAVLRRPVRRARAAGAPTSPRSSTGWPA